MKIYTYIIKARLTFLSSTYPLGCVLLSAESIPQARRILTDPIISPYSWGTQMILLVGQPSISFMIMWHTVPVTVTVYVLNMFWWLSSEAFVTKWHGMIIIHFSYANRESWNLEIIKIHIKLYAALKSMYKLYIYSVSVAPKQWLFGFFIMLFQFLLIICGHLTSCDIMLSPPVVKVIYVIRVTQVTQSAQL